MPKYLLIIKGGEPNPEVMGQEDFNAHMGRYMALTERLRTEGIFLAGEGLDPAGKTVAGGHGKPVITDGPLPEAGELIGGFYLVEAKDEAHATELALAIPALELGGVVEVRPVMQYE